MEKESKRVCFVVMPYGRTESEIKWFKGWYKECLATGAEKAGYTPQLAANAHTPTAINNEIRLSLVQSEMVLCDLGGVTAEESPNPNVMYELGIRHAFNLPVVILAWKKQQLPFDIANQRIIMEDREMFSLETNITQIVEHIKSAESGAFYRPMDAVRRVAALDSAAKSVTTDTVLRDLVEEVASLKGTIGSSAAGRTGRVHRPNNSPKCDATAPHNNQAQIYHLLGSTERRKELMQQLEARGISKQQSGDFFSHMIPGGLVSCACTWGIESWVEYVASCIGGNISCP